MSKKVICADVSCVHNGDKNVCQSPSIRLSWESVMTVHGGRREFNMCKSRKVSHEYLELEKEVRKVFRQ